MRSTWWCLETRAIAVAALVAGAAPLGCIGDIGDSGKKGARGGPLDNTPQLGPDGRYICDQGPYPVPTQARRLTPVEYQNAIADVFGSKVAPSAQYPGGYGKSPTGYSTAPNLYTVGEQTVTTLMQASEDVAEGVAGVLGELLPCAQDAGASTDCANQFVDTFVTRAYRRPLGADERAPLLATYEDGRASGASFTEAIAMMTSHALQSPQFLYITEAASADGRALDGYEIASRLSFFFWQTIPDAQLLAKAASGELTDPTARANEAQRLLADPRADGALRRLFREWTQTTDVEPGDKDPALLSGFDDAYAASMAESFDRFTADKARSGTLTELLTSQDVWVDANMASFYGVPAPASGWAQVSLDDRYSGMLTQPLFLASAAHYSTTSYVFRGRFLRKRLLCTELGAPPGDAQAQFDKAEKPADPTGKDLSKVVTSNPVCGGCHTIIDPAGLALEGFDAIGRHRDTYPTGKGIDPSGTMTAVGDHEIVFESYDDLFAALATEPAVATCVGKQFVRFAMSRLDTVQDACAVQAVGDVIALPSGLIADALVALVSSDSFAYRRDN